MRMIQKFLFAGLLLGLMTLAGCDRAVSNVQTMISDDCGKQWKLVPVGNTVPSRVGPCALKVTVPNAPMIGDAKFSINFLNQVVVAVSASYDYTISDPLKFIQGARYLGRQNSAGDGSDNSTSIYESAENAIIDKKIREIAGTLLREVDIVNFNQGQFEDKLEAAVNEVLLKERGVSIGGLSFVPTPSEQTLTAIDAVSARRIYAAAGITELGDKIIVARAGASKVTVSTTEAR